MSGDDPLVVQADHTILVEVVHPRFEEARARLRRFAELDKSPEYVHFYRMTPISIWHAAALGEPLADILGYLQSASRYPVAPSVLRDVTEWYERYGMLRFLPSGVPERLRLRCREPDVLAEIRQSRIVGPLLGGGGNGASVEFPAQNRGVLKHCLIKLGYPVQDEAGYLDGAPLRIDLVERTPCGTPFALRAYQREAADAFHAGGSRAGGCGVIVLPCGAGKTVVGMAVMDRVAADTLILTTNTVAVRQWRRELREKTSLEGAEIGEYTGERKQIRPVTIATYQILTWRKRRQGPFAHFRLLEDHDWGLIIYDEVHLLPAPVFRATAAIQARRRLGLTATLVREDGKEGDVFSLIGPKRYELPWRDLERKGYLAVARCVEVRVRMSDELSRSYRVAGARARLKIASANERKGSVLAGLLERHAADRVLVIGLYLDQLHAMAAQSGTVLITGKTPMAERERWFRAFRSGDISRLMVSKVGNFAIDLPDANVAVQVSGSFGSRQEEAQRLGRILRPKRDGGEALFYSLVTEDTCEQEFGARRQLFLAEQGYAYRIVDADDLEVAPGRSAQA